MAITNKYELGSRIRSTRELCGKRQVDVARGLGIGRSTYSMWESGVNEVPANILPRIAEILGRPIGYLFEEKTENDYIDDETISLYKQLSEEQRAQVNRMIKAMFPHLKADIEPPSQVN